MKIALLHYSAPPIVGGVESVLAHQARLMARAGHEVIVIAGRGEAWDGKIGFAHIPLVDSRHPEVLAVKARLDAGEIPPDFEGMVGAIASRVQSAASGAEVLIAHNVCSLNKNLALTAALHHLSGSPDTPRLVLWHHDLAWATARYRHELHSGYPWDLLRTDWPGTTQVVVSALRQAELAHLLGIPLERVLVVPNGLDIASFLKLEPEAVAWVEQMDLLSAAPLLLAPVRITPRKNLQMALRILASLRKEMPRAGLLVTGPPGAHRAANDQYFTELLELRTRLGLEGSAYFLAELTRSNLPDILIADLYRLADALLLPSREEGFGIPLIEAALSRRPVFCSNLEPLQALGGNDVRYFSPDADPHRVAAMIADTLQGDPVYRLAVRIRQQYSWERIYREKIEPILMGEAH